ncbi:MAG TPA: YlxR family protein [Patescibacteria group bacterium]|nr:YlxR family protein [Patescibacteria group bacterium]
MTTKGAEPIRTCLGCRRRRPKGAMLRLVRGADGCVSVDDTAPGRGAYVCRDPECQERALKPARLAHAFRGPSAAKTELIETVVSGR